MNRDDFREIALIRVNEALVLLRNKNYDGAYYLCGYAIECGLKACIAKQTRQFDFPDKKTVDTSYTHDLEKLINTAGLKLNLEKEIKRNPGFEVYWETVGRWSEASRYEKHTKKDAQNFFVAVAHKTQGVLKWIQQYW